MILCLGTTQTESHPYASCIAFCTCTLALSPSPRFSDIFILMLKERSDSHHDRKRQQHAHRSALRLYRSQALRAQNSRNDECAQFSWERGMCTPHIEGVRMHIRVPERGSLETRFRT